MELLHLQYFREVAALENITKAARQLYISQPALSTAIARLEKELGFLLFDRMGNRIGLTEAGHCYLEYVNSAFSILEEGKVKSREIANSNNKRLKIASGFGVVRNILYDYKILHPESELELQCCDTDRIHAMVVSKEVDVGLNLGEIIDSRLINRDLMVGRYYVAVNGHHPFHDRKSVTLKELDGQLLFCSNIAHTLEIGQEIFQKAGVSCNLLKLDEKDVLFSAAVKGLGGVFCMPMFKERKSPESEEAEVELFFIPISDCMVKGRVTLVMRKDYYYTTENQDFLNFLSQRFLMNQTALNEDLERRGI